MEELVEVAKAHGVILAVSDEHQRSEASRAMIMMFLTGMVALDKANTIGVPVRAVDTQLATGDSTSRNEQDPSPANGPSTEDQEERLRDLQKEIDLLRRQMSDMQDENVALAGELSAATGTNVQADNAAADEWVYRPWCQDCGERFVLEGNEEDPSCPYHDGQSVTS
ncbi:hypothetical protein MBLNU457_g0158t1 [Dothideomycetes sp. NU457]